jgi:hypothetical protein
VIILIASSGDPRREFEVEEELQRAFGVLHSAQIPVLGEGRFQDGSGYVVLARETDGPAALALLDMAGIAASELKPRTDPEPSKSGGSIPDSQP